MSEQESKALTRDCVTLENTIDEALDWVGRYLSPSGGQLAVQNSLKNYRRLARRYHRAAQRKPCAAVFGASQVGKSYLVSNMAKLPGADTLEIIVPGENQRIDFIKHINPSGGRESTGLVTRFTIDNNHHPGDAPFFLRLLSQTDIVKILTNGYLSDIKDRQDEIDREKIQEFFKELRQKTSLKPIDGMGEDDIYDLKDYLIQNFNDQVSIRDLTRINFWEDIAGLVPRLKSEDRWQVFHLLWGKLPLLTDLFNKLSRGLKALGFAPEARCGLDALVPKEINREGTVTPNTIIDVQVINRLLEQDKDTLGAVTVTGSTGCTASLSKSLLTGLIAEITMILPPELGTQPSRSFFNHIDLLDFPGARSRKKIPLANLAGNSIHENIEVFLRGKIAFLFDRYSYENEITSLLLCIADGPQEVQSIPQLIGDWVYKTHGDIPEKRNNKMISLLTIFTKFNIELEGKPSDQLGDPSSHDSKWSARLKINFNDYMSIPVEQKWPEYWDMSGSFKNCFLLRDPKFSKAVYQGLDAEDKGTETAVRPGSQQKLKDMETSFLNFSYAKKHFHDHQRAWQEVAQPGKSGIEYIVEYLNPTTDPSIKLNQLKLQVSLLKEKIANHLKQHYIGGDQVKALENARIDSEKTAVHLLQMMRSKNSFGLFIHHLTISDDFAWKIYYDVENPRINYEIADIEAVPSQPDVLIKPDFDDIAGILDISIPITPGLQEGSSNNQMQKEYRNKTAMFVELLVGNWLSNLEELADSPNLLAKMAMDKEIYQLILREISTSLRRVDLLKLIADAVKEEVERFYKNKNIDLIARISKLIVNRFINTVGWDSVEIDRRPKLKLDGQQETPIFTQYEVASPTHIDLDIDFPGRSYFIQWIKGIQETFKANVEYIYGGGIVNPEANQILGRLLERIR